MRILPIAAAVSIAAAGALAAFGASAAPLRLAQADISVRVGDHHGEGEHREGEIRRHDEFHHGWHAGCRTETIKERHGDRVVIKKIRRC